MDNNKDAFISFYSPWCVHCKHLLSKYEEAAKKWKEKNPKLVLAKKDSTENEIEPFNINGYPTIKFYPENQKDKVLMDYKGQELLLISLKEMLIINLFMRKKRKMEKLLTFKYNITYLIDDIINKLQITNYD